MLLPSEGVLLGVLFDAESLAHLPSGWWSPVGQIAPRVMPVAAAVATSGLLLAGPRIRHELHERCAAPDSVLRTLAFVGAHLVAFAVLLVLTAAVFGGNLPRDRVGTYVIAWLIAAGLTAITWAASLLPAGTARVLMAHTGALLLASIACGLIAWAAGQYTQLGWGPLRRGTLFGAAFILRAIDSTAWADPAHFLVGARDFTVEVTSECSGYEGVGLAVIALGAWLVLYRRELRFPSVLLLLPVAILAVWLANTFRIAALVYVGAHWSADIAAGGFHSYAGALLFAGVVLSTAWVGHRAPIFSRQLPRHVRSGPNPAAPYLIPILLMTAAGLVTGLFSRDGDNTLYPIRIAAGAAALWFYRCEYRRASHRPAFLIPILGGVLVCGAWLALTRTLHDPTFLPTTTDPSWRIGWLTCRVLGAVIVVPIAEELAFRGYLARRLMDADFTKVPLSELSWPSILISSLLFGLLHQAFLAATIAGIAYALLARHRGRLSDAILAHAATNALLALAALMQG